MKTNWQTKKLGEMCGIEIGKTPSRANKKLWDAEKVTTNVWLSIRDLTDAQDQIISDSREYVSDRAVPSLSLVKRGTLLVSFKLTLGRLAFAGRDLYTNEAIAALTIRGDREISKDFLYQYLNYFDWVAATKGDVKVKGKTLNKTKLKEIEINYPPLAEQKRIVKKLDLVFEQIEQAKAHTEQNLKNAKELFESYLQGVFAELRKSFQEERFGEVCHFVRGPFGGSLKKSVFKSDGYVVYEQRHAIYDQFDEIRYFIDEGKFNEMKRFEVLPGDLIMSCSGTMGKIAIVPSGIRRGIINQALLKLTPSKKMTSRFLQFWMQSNDFQESLRHYSQGAAIKNVASVKILKDIKLPLPPVTEQKSIVKKLDALSAQTKKLEFIYQKKLADLDELKKSILQKAFKGEL